MNFIDGHLSAAARRISRIVPGLKPAGCQLGLIALCALAPAAFFTGKVGGAVPAMRSARVSLAGLDLSTSDGVHDARARIHKAARDLCARNLGQRSLDECVDDVTAAAQRQIKARTMKVSLADLDLNTPQGVQAARDRLQAVARRACQELQNGSDIALAQYSVCVDETFAHALRQTDLLQRMSVDF